MSAQKELAVLLAAPDEAHAVFSDAALKFIRDHGPAIVELIEASRDEFARTNLVSLPLKHVFREDRGMSSIDEVHDWMRTARRRFEAALLAVITEPKA
jgi:hypothetical protein